MDNPRFKIAFRWQLLLIVCLLGMPVLAPAAQSSSAALSEPASVLQAAFASQLMMLKAMKSILTKQPRSPLRCALIKPRPPMLC